LSPTFLSIFVILKAGRYISLRRMYHSFIVFIGKLMAFIYLLPNCDLLLSNGLVELLVKDPAIQLFAVLMLLLLPCSICFSAIFSCHFYIILLCHLFVSRMVEKKN